MYSLAAVYSLLNISIASARAEDLDSDQKLRQNDHMSCFPTNPMPSSRVTHANPLLCHPVRAPAQDLRFDLWNGRVCFFSSTLQRTSPWSRKLYERRYFQITARLTRWVSQRPQTRLGVYFCVSCLLFLFRRRSSSEKRIFRRDASGAGVWFWMSICSVERRSQEVESHNYGKLS